MLGRSESRRRWWLAMGLSLLAHVGLLSLVSGTTVVVTADSLPTLDVRLIGEQRPSSKPAEATHTSAKQDPIPAEPAPAAPQTSASSASSTPVSEPSTADQEVLPLHRVTRAPRMLHVAEPVYPESERARGKEASVVVEIVIDARGRLLEAAVIQSGGAAFDQAVLDAVRHSAFAPGYLSELPVAVRTQIRYPFKLR